MGRKVVLHITDYFRKTYVYSSMVYLFQTCMTFFLYVPKKIMSMF